MNTLKWFLLNACVMVFGPFFVTGSLYKGLTFNMQDSHPETISQKDVVERLSKLEERVKGLASIETSKSAGNKDEAGGSSEGSNAEETNSKDVVQQIASESDRLTEDVSENKEKILSLETDLVKMKENYGETKSLLEDLERDVSSVSSELTDIKELMTDGSTPKDKDECPTSMGYMSMYSPRLCFKLSDVNDIRTWSKAQDQCKSEGGSLIILNTDAKFDFIDHYMVERKKWDSQVWKWVDPEGTVFVQTVLVDNSNTPNAFVGMVKTVDDTFEWTDGTTHAKKWGIEEPDFVSYQKCVGMWKSDGLGDIECYKARRYLCEVKVSK